jgi:hypothetical protein
MKEKEDKKRQRSIRLPESDWEWIESLPPEYGKDSTAKIYALLYRGKRMIDKEMKMWEYDSGDTTEPESKRRAR